VLDQAAAGKALKSSADGCNIDSKRRWKSSSIPVVRALGAALCCKWHSRSRSDGMMLGREDEVFLRLIAHTHSRERIVHISPGAD
jgi:hypothetical protein